LHKVIPMVSSVASGSVEILAGHARAIATDPNNPDILRAAAKALLATLGDPGLAAWDTVEKDAFYRALITQPDSPVRPPILAREAASAITSQNRPAAAALAREIGPLLSRLLAEEPDCVPGYVNAVILALVLRADVDETVIPPARIGKLHLDWFEHFDPADLALPYSVMFNAASFGANRDEVLARYWPERGALPDHPGLRLSHVLFFEWLAVRDAFDAPDNTDLAHWFHTRLSDVRGDLDAERATARTLLLRHWRPDSVLDSGRLAALGLSDVLPLARRYATTRSGLPKGSPSRRGAAWLSARPYQAAQAGLHLARLAIPALRLGRRRPRVAICVSGQLRGYKRAFETWRQHLLPEIEATVFVHSWRQIGRSDAQPFRYVLPFGGARFCEVYRTAALSEGYAAMQARYPTLFATLGASAQTDEAELKAFYDTDHVVLDDETAPPFATYTNQQKMHSKLQAADHMARAAGPFDLHIRLRPDLPMTLAAFDWRDLLDACRSAPRLFVEKSYGLHYNNLMIGDQCAIADPRTMRPYADAWNHYPELVDAGLVRCPEGFRGHLSLAMCCWVHGLDVAKAPIRFGNLVEAAPLSSAEILAALEQDDRGNAIDRRLIAAARRDQSG